MIAVQNVDVLNFEKETKNMMVWLYWIIPVIFEISLISLNIYLGYVFEVQCNYTKFEMYNKIDEFVLVHVVYIFTAITITFICQAVDTIFKGQIGLIVLPIIIAIILGFISYDAVTVDFIEINDELGRLYRRKLRKEIKI